MFPLGLVQRDAVFSDQSFDDVLDLLAHVAIAELFELAEIELVDKASVDAGLQVLEELPVLDDHIVIALESIIEDHSIPQKYGNSLNYLTISASDSMDLLTGERGSSFTT